MTIYAINTPPSDYVAKVFNSLKCGEGRFGWSGEPTADLYRLKERIDKDEWKSLTEGEKECYQDWLLQLKPEDYVVYINIPEYGKCTLAKVTGEYFWRFNDEDFNHRFSVDRESLHTFDRNDANVHPALSARLKLRGRWWTVYAENEFHALLDSLHKETAPAPRRPEDNLRFLSEQITQLLSEMAGKIQHTHPNKDLECLIEKVFEKVPGVKGVTRQEGRADQGADLTVELGFGAIPELIQTLVVQIKSYEGDLSSTSALEDIRRAFNRYKNASMGIIVSTAASSSKDFRVELDKLQEKERKPVALLMGADLAAFCLHYGGDLFRK